MSETVADGTPVGITHGPPTVMRRTRSATAWTTMPAGVSRSIRPRARSRSGTTRCWTTKPPPATTVTVRATSSDGSSSTHDVHDRPDGRHGRIACRTGQRQRCTPRTKCPRPWLTARRGRSRHGPRTAMRRTRSATAWTTMPADVSRSIRPRVQSRSRTTRCWSSETAANHEVTVRSDQQRRLIPAPRCLRSA